MENPKKEFSQRIIRELNMGKVKNAKDLNSLKLRIGKELLNKQKLVVSVQTRLMLPYGINTPIELILIYSRPMELASMELMEQLS